MAKAPGKAMSKAPGHAELRAGVQKARASHQQTGQALDQLEAMLQAMQGAKQQQMQQQPPGPSTGMTNAGASPLGGKAIM